MVLLFTLGFVFDRRACPFIGPSRQRAAEYSFLISIPAILGAMLLKLPDAAGLASAVSPAALAVGVAAALVVGLASLVLLIRIIRSGRLYLFGFYLIPLGVALLIVL